MFSISRACVRTAGFYIYTSINWLNVAQGRKRFMFYKGKTLVLLGFKFVFWVRCINFITTHRVSRYISDKVKTIYLSTHIFKTLTSQCNAEAELTTRHSGAAGAVCSHGEQCGWLWPSEAARTLRGWSAGERRRLEVQRSTWGKMTKTSTHCDGKDPYSFI